MLPASRPRPRPDRRQADAPPAWAADLTDALEDVQRRLSRIEGGLALAAFLISLGVGILAAVHGGR